MSFPANSAHNSDEPKAGRDADIRVRCDEAEQEARTDEKHACDEQQTHGESDAGGLRSMVPPIVVESVYTSTRPLIVRGRTRPTVEVRAVF